MMKKIGLFLLLLMTTMVVGGKVVNPPKKAHGQPVVTPPIFIPSSQDHTFTPLHLYFVDAATGNDSNNGTSTSTPWKTPNHAVVCGDVILAKAGDYSTIALAGGFSPFGAVSSCPSMTGGIDGVGGIHAAVLLCAGADLGTNGCFFNLGNTSSAVGMNWLASNWAIEGWQCNGGGGNTRCFQVYSCPIAQGGTGTVIHHVININNIAVNTGVGYDVDDCGQPGGQNTFGGDYWAIVANI